MTIKVKPLVWKRATYIRGSRAVDHYALFRNGWLYVIHERRHSVYLYSGDHKLAGTVYPQQDMGYAGVPFSTVEAARRAAQEEWEAFVLAALEGGGNTLGDSP